MRLKVKAKPSTDSPTGPVDKPSIATKQDKASEAKRLKGLLAQEVPYEIPDFPRSLGPTSIPLQPDHLAMTSPEYIVTLDAGTFRYVWEMVEDKARLDHQKFRAMKNVKRVSEQAVESFRRSAGVKAPAKKLRLKAKK